MSTGTRTASSRRKPAPAPPVRPPRAVSDRVLAAAAAGGSALVALSTLSGGVELGDSAETVAAVEVAGVAHAPGYVAYIAAAKAFATVLPVGDLALRVNLFSVLCSAGTAALLFVLVRRLGAGQVAALVATGAHAIGLSTWFYAGYAKSYAFTTLLLVGVLLAVQLWRLGGGVGWLALAGGLTGLSLGASWQAMAVAVPGLVVLLLTAKRLPRPVALLTPVAAGLLAASAVVLLILWRASTSPAVNWGSASSVGGVLDLVLMRDFSLGEDLGGGGWDPVAFAREQRFVRGLMLVIREFGFLALLVPIGAYATWQRRREVPFWGLLAVLLGNLVGVALFVQMYPTLRWVSNDLVVQLGGFVLAAKLIAAIWIGFGAGWLLTRFTAARARPRGPARPPGRQRTALLAGALAVLVLATLAFNAGPANHRVPDFAGEYASNVLDQLPPDAALFVFGVERAFVLEQAQIAGGQRPDVELVRIPHLLLPWYREQRGLEPIPGGHVSGTYAGEFAETVRLGRELIAQGRPVYVDVAAAHGGRRELEPLGLKHAGLVARASGTPAPGEPDFAAARAAVQDYRESGLGGDAAARFPTKGLRRSYAIAHAELGFGFEQAGDRQRAAQEYSTALRYDPGYTAPRKALDALDAR